MCIFFARKELKDLIWKNHCAYTLIVAGGTYTKADPFAGQAPRQAMDRSQLAQLFSQLTGVQALDSKQKGSGVLVAVLDSGIQYNHGFLSPNVSVDQQGNIIGKNYINTKQLPLDDNGHGTHVSGLASGMIGGVATNSTIMGVKVMSALGSGDMGTIAAAIMWAAENGAKVINLSLGGQSDGQIPEAFKTAMDYARQQGAFVVVAAGNETSDNDEVPVLPAGMAPYYDNMLAIAAVDTKGDLADYSNWGVKTVDMAAPGGTMEDPLRSYDYLEPEKNGFAMMQGTSMASPVTAGVVALMMEKNPNMSLGEIKNAMINSGRKLASLEGRVRSGRLVTAPR